MQKLVSKGRKLRPSTRALVRLPDKKASPFYQSPEWRALMAQIIRERGRVCQDAAHDPIKPRFGIRVFGDHIIEIADGGAKLDQRNVLLRCGACHTRKTAEARRRRLHDRRG